MMKFFKCLILFLLYILVNGKLVPFHAKSVETLVIFSFTENSIENAGSYVKYFSYLASFIDIKKDFDENFRFYLFFGSYNITEILQISDASIFRNPLLNLEEKNITVEAYIPEFSETSQCDQIFLCQIIRDFFNISRNVSTKLNLLIISDICPHQSIFEEFYKNDKERLFTSTFLVSTLENKDICNVNSTSIDHYFVPPTDFSSVDSNDRLALFNRTIFRNSTKAENYILIFVKKENLNISIKFIADYYKDATKCDLKAPLKDKRDSIYFITLFVSYDTMFPQKYEEIKTTFSDTDLNTKFDNIKYLEQNFYDLLQNKNFGEIPTAYDISGTLIQYDAQHIIIFTDDYSFFPKLNRESLNKDNRTVDYILYMTSSDDKFVENVKNSFYKDDSDKAAFHIMTPESKENVFGENTCQLIKKAVPFKLEFWQYGLIGVGIIIVLIIGNIVYTIFKKNPISAFMEAYEFENKDELTKECNKLQLSKNDFKINFNVVKGRGAFSTVYKAALKRSLIPSQKSMTNDNNSSEYCIVAAKLINNYEEEEMFNVIGEIQAVQKLGSHEKICTLLRWSTHSGAPCLFFELMEMDLQSYLISLRNKSNNLLTKDELVLSLTDTGDHFNVPEFDRKQQLIFMQILWQISLGLEYIASKRIVHRDVAARNILLSRYNNTETYIAKITDFGLCILLEKDTNTFRAPEFKKFPYKWLAIESLVDRIFSQASDIWAFGILMMEIYTCAGILYPGIGSNEIVYFLKHDKRMEKPKNMSQEMYDLASVCWDKKPYSRKTFSQLNLDLKQILRQLSSNNDDYKDYWQMNDQISICSKISLKQQ